MRHDDDIAQIACRYFMLLHLNGVYEYTVTWVEKWEKKIVKFNITEMPK